MPEKQHEGTFVIFINGERKITVFSKEHAMRQAREQEDTDVVTIEVFKLVAMSVPRVEEV